MRFAVADVKPDARATMSAARMPVVREGGTSWCAVQGGAFSQVKVLPEELTVHLRSYGRMAEDRHEAARTTVFQGKAGKLAGPTKVNPEQASKRCRECRPCHREGKAAAPGSSTVADRATRRGNGEGT